MGFQATHTSSSFSLPFHISLRDFFRWFNHLPVHRSTPGENMFFCPLLLREQSTASPLRHPWQNAVLLDSILDLKFVGDLTLMENMIFDILRRQMKCSSCIEYSRHTLCWLPSPTIFLQLRRLFGIWPTTWVGSERGALLMVSNAHNYSLVSVRLTKYFSRCPITSALWKWYVLDLGEKTLRGSVQIIKWWSLSAVKG